MPLHNDATSPCPDQRVEGIAPTRSYQDKVSLFACAVNGVLFALCFPIAYANLGLYGDIWIWGGGLLLNALLGHALLRGTWVNPYQQALSFMGLTALQIHVGQGQIEFHFGFFVLFALLAPFKNWRVIAFAAIIAALHHLLFYWLQGNGWRCLAFPAGSESFLKVVLHAVYVIAETAVLCIFAHFLKRQDEVSAERQAILSLLQPVNGQIDLQKRANVQHQENAVIASVYKGYQSEMLALFDSVRTMNESSLSIEQQVKQSRTALNTDRQNILNELGHSTDTMRQVVEKAQEGVEKIWEISSLSTTVLEQSQRGFESVNESFTHMDAIPATFSQLTNKLGNLCGVLESLQAISDQTRLLSLNAAIEASRSGEAGRGFAIVAEEVRKLSDKSTADTRRIADLLKDVNGLLNTTSGSIDAAGQQSAHAKGILQQLNSQLLNLQKDNQTLCQFFEAQVNDYAKANDAVDNLV